MARPAFRLLAYLFLLAVVVQFLLAGLGVMGGEDIDLHTWFGRIALHLLPLFMFGLAFAAKMGRTMIIMVGVAFVLVIIQAFFSAPDLDPRWLRSLHVLNGLAIYVLAHHIAQRAGRGAQNTAPAM